MKRNKASSRQWLREGLGGRLVRVDGLCSALGLEPDLGGVFGVGCRAV